jgi:hypothetical protein
LQAQPAGLALGYKSGVRKHFVVVCKNSLPAEIAIKRLNFIAFRM